MRSIIPKNAKLVPPEAKKVFDGIIYDVYQWQQKMFDGSFETFEMLKRPDTVKIIAIKDDKIVVLKQEQPDSGGPYIDLPGGRHDYEPESELDAARRELLEETGMSFSNWKLLNAQQPRNKIEQFVYIFLATNFEDQIPQKLDSGEKIEVKLYDFIDFKKMCNDPKSRMLPNNLIDDVNSINDLINLPEY